VAYAATFTYVNTANMTFSVNAETLLLIRIIYFQEPLIQHCTVQHNIVALIKKKIKFSYYKETQNGEVAKSYMRKGFLIYEEMRKYLTYKRRPLVIYYFATAPFRISL
jgi:hypothetical protein